MHRKRISIFNILWSREFALRPDGPTRDRNNHSYIERVFLSYFTNLSPLRGLGNTNPRRSTELAPLTGLWKHAIRHLYRAVAPNGAMVGTVPTANQYKPSSFDRASHLGVSGSMFVNLKKKWPNRHVSIGPNKIFLYLCGPLKNLYYEQYHWQETGN